jgi:hypothetical protein
MRNHDADRPHRRFAASRRVLHRPALALAGAFFLAAAAPAFAHHAARVSRQATPQATVRDFLSAVVDRDGGTACQYLTPRARVSFEHHLPDDPSCQQFFAGAGLTLGGLEVQSDHDLAGLSYRVVPEGTARRVDVSHGGQTISFLLRLGSPTDLQEFLAPPTAWRIDSSVAMLAPPTAAPSRNAV